jgi:hypothetical protein
MREFRSYGSVRGALRNERPYREHVNVSHCSAIVTFYSLFHEMLENTGAGANARPRCV